MMKELQKITLGNIRVTYRPDSDPDAAAIHKAASYLNRKVGSAPQNLQISKKSIDARRRAELSFVYTVYAEIDAKPSVMAKLESDPDIMRFTEPVLELTHGKRPMEHRPVIVGFGPA